jgi:centrosomal protein CEP97
VLDVSKKSLKKIPKIERSKDIKTLILDENELQKIDNIDTYLGIEKVRRED